MNEHKIFKIMYHSLLSICEHINWFCIGGGGRGNEDVMYKFFLNKNRVIVSLNKNCDKYRLQ